VHSVNGDAQEGDDDGYFGDDAGDNIEDLTEPPALVPLAYCITGPSSWG
jgi:hypothetical protein